MHAQGQSLRCAWTCQSKSAQILVILVSVARDKSRPQIKLYHLTKLIFILCLLKIISTDYLFVVVIFDGYNDNRRRQQCHSADRDDCINRRKYTGQPTQP